MFGFRLLLLAMLVVLGGYTAVVINDYGMGLFQVFFGDIGKVAWPGQFNLDFLFMLMLSGLWVAWRHEFSPVGFLLGTIAFFGGAGFLTIYLLILIAREKGSMQRILLGERKLAA